MIPSIAAIYNQNIRYSKAGQVNVTSELKLGSKIDYNLLKEGFRRVDSHFCVIALAMRIILVATIQCTATFLDLFFSKTLQIPILVSPKVITSLCYYHRVLGFPKTKLSCCRLVIFATVTTALGCKSLDAVQNILS